MHQLKFLKKDGRVGFVDQSQVKELSKLDPDQMVYLGLDEHLGVHYWAANVDADLVTKLEPDFGLFTEVRYHSYDLPAFEASLVGLARSILDWHARYKFCAACGQRLKMAESGFKQVCSNDGCDGHKSVQNYSYPRTDPVAIVAVGNKQGDKILLGRNRRFPPGMYSTLAGFVEPGESLEEACAREVFEECGVVLDHVAYHSSQPWAFPSQLMLGCIATAKSDTIKVDEKELEDAQWFTREQVADALKKGSKDLSLPPPNAIAHHLIKHWVQQSSPSL
ncbi:NAD(+) diphosphatase [Gorgonomyces haynaldii]|nr:NAD(+) diphosphatase [Gorgonomyces haynaldii]